MIIIKVYVNPLGQWILLDEEYYLKNPTVDITHNSIRFIVPICYIQAENY